MKFIYKGGGGHGDQIMATTNRTNRWYSRNAEGRAIFNPEFKVKPGVVQVKYPDLAEKYAGFVMVEPHIKGTFSGENKRWPWEYWQELADRSRWPLLQCAPEGKRFLDGVTRVVTKNFEQAVSVLSGSQGIVTTEGGLHHAAGALGKPAVVIFGAFNSPKLFGYDFHENLDEPDPEGLGWRHTHPACTAAMRRITVDRVLAAMVRLWG